MAANTARFIGTLLTLMIYNGIIVMANICPPNVPNTWDDAELIGLNNSFYPLDLDNDEHFQSPSEDVAILIGDLNITAQISSQGLITFGGVLPELFVYFCQLDLGDQPSNTTLQNPVLGDQPSNTTDQNPFLGTLGDGGVYYNQSTDEDLLCRFGAHVQSLNLAPSGYKPTTLFIVTWYNVTCGFFGTARAISPGLYSYQAVIGSDGDRTFVCYIYGIIPDNGVLTARVGVDDSGGANQFTFLVTLQPIHTIDTTNGNTGQQGKWIFQIEGDVFTPLPCVPGSFTLSTRYGAQCGGKPIFIFGPCYDNSPGVKCDFDGTIVDGTIVDSSRAFCITPLLVSFGALELKVSIDDGNTYNYTSAFYIYGRDFVLEVNRLNPLAWLSPPFAPLSFTWNAAALTIFDTVTIVHVDVVEYTLAGTLNSIIRLITDTTNDGMESIDGNLPETLSPEKLLLFCALRITPSNSSLPQVELWSDFHPCLWYSAKLLDKISRGVSNIANAVTIRNIISQQLGPSPSMADIAQNLQGLLSGTVGDATCNNWISFESSNPVTFNLPKPPCRQPVAIGDRRFREICSGADCQFYHQGATACYVAWFGFPRGQEVCYNANGIIIITGAAGGGTVDRVFRGWGRTFEHIRHDLLPFVACCKASFNCDAYYMRRPTDNCIGYRPPRPIRWWGDPHFWTLDGLAYTFNPVGEFWLILNSNFELQARAERSNLASDQGTIISAIAVKKGVSPKIEVSLNDSLVLVVRVDGQEEDLTAFINNVFPTPDNLVHILKISDEELDLRFLRQGNMVCDGEVIRIRRVFGTLRVDTLLPDCYKGVVLGLQGDFDDEPTNDHQPRVGNLVPHTASMQAIHNNFGVTWRVRQSESLFTYGVGLGESYESFNDPTYEPRFFTDSDLLNTPNGGFCNSNLQCLYDFRVTGNQNFAEASREAGEEVQELFDLLRSASNPCLSNPCVTGVCTPSSTPTATIFTCACPPGFSGTTCNDNSCDPNPCLNRGTCQGDTSVNRYNCICPSNFVGTNCQTRVDSTVCDSSPCRNAATCQFIGGQYLCTCPVGYTGRYCEQAINACDGRPCLNGGVCSRTPPTGYSCQCQPGYTGAHCQTEINPCDSAPCLNGGVCSQTTSATEYSCRCPADYTGRQCQTAICDPNPCQNGASCLTDNKGGVQCTCLPGFGGIYCHITPDNLRTGTIVSLVLFLVLALFLLTLMLVLLCREGVNCCCFHARGFHGHPPPIGVIKTPIRPQFDVAPRLRPLHVKHPVYSRPRRFW